MRCQLYGHIAKECKSLHNVCGRCVGHHPTQSCTAHSSDFYCAVCKMAGHTPADRKCPSLLHKIQEHSQRNPDRNYRFFVTKHPETWIRDDEITEPSINEPWRVEARRGYEDNWRMVQRGNGRGHLAGGAVGEGGGMQPTGQGRQTKTMTTGPTRTGPIDRYLSHSRTRPRPTTDPSSSQQSWGNTTHDTSNATQT